MATSPSAPFKVIALAIHAHPGILLYLLQYLTYIRLKHFGYGIHGSVALEVLLRALSLSPSCF